MPSPKTAQLMKEPIPLTFQEEVWNAVLHGVCSLALLILLPILAISFYQKGGWLYVFGISVYLICMFFMFTFSTLYHIMPYHTLWKTITRKLDHIAILLAIAGTYTPVCIVLLGTSGLWLLGLEWALAAFGIFLKAFSNKTHPVLSMCLYVLMGWLAVFFLPVLLRESSFGLLSWIIAGGLCYTVGIYFYSHHKRYYHVVWHVLIIAAFICQLIGITLYL